MNIFESVVLVYAAVLALLSSVVGYVGIRAVAAHARRRPTTALADMVANDYFEAISILVPAYNEEKTIVTGVRSMLNLQHPRFDVIVANDGSTDHTLDELIEHFALVEVPIAHDEDIRTEPLRRMFRSLTHANLTVLDKEYGGRADAQNAALNLARRPLVCVAPASTTLDGLALIRASQKFLEDENVVAVVSASRPADLGSASHRWVNRIQRAQFARDRLVQAAGWSELGALTNTFGVAMFNRRAVVRVGGWWTGTAADDVDMAFKLHKHYRDTDREYRIAFLPDPVCKARKTPTFGDLLRRRSRRARGVIEVLPHHAGMVFNPRYGTVGLFSLPHRWLLEVCSPVIEVGAYAYLIVSAAMGRFDVAFAAAFFALTMGYSIVSAVTAMGAEALVAPRFSSLAERAAVVGAAVVEQIVVRPISVVVSLQALLPGRRQNRTERAIVRSARARRGSAPLRAAS